MVVGVVDEIHHVGGVLARVAMVQASQGLHRLDAIEAAVHIHAAEQRLVEAGLELVGHEEPVVSCCSNGRSRNVLLCCHARFHSADQQGSAPSIQPIAEVGLLRQGGTPLPSEASPCLRDQFSRRGG
jgi:hypothetical protein